MKSFNINSCIYAELNQSGWDWIRRTAIKSFERNPLLVERYMDAIRKNTKLYKVNGELKKLTKFQLHDAMSIFGPHFCASESPFCWAVIYMDDKDLTEVEVVKEPQGE